MEAKRLKLVIIAGLVLTLCSNIAFGGLFGRGEPRFHDRDHDRDHGHGHGFVRVVVFPPRIRPVVIFPPRRIFVEPSVVVIPPITTTTTVIVPEETVTVWITNGNGSKSAVTLKKEKQGPGYIGPKGEYYSSMPTEEQLEVLYGIRPAATVKSSFTVWITNENGSMSPVTLVRKNGGFIGPSGEYYPNMPTEEQLKSLYSPQAKVQAEEGSVLVWVDNSDGTKTSVVLTKQGSEYVGPNGEHYQSMPTKEQLKMMYSQKSMKVASNSTTVWIQNSDGSKTPITLQKDGSNFIGPAGEKYSSMPTESQLKLLYGSAAEGSENELSCVITKNDGTKATIVLKKEGSDFVGPKGEHYENIPTEEQLRMIYGK